jgi:hypothetical protein
MPRKNKKVSFTTKERNKKRRQKIIAKKELLGSLKIRKSPNKKKVVKFDIQKEIGKIIVKLKNPSDRLIARTKKRKIAETFYNNQLLVNQKNFIQKYTI